MKTAALSPDQVKVVREVVGRIRAGASEVRLGGLAGTGKTTIAVRLPHELGLAPGEVAFCAPTGKAANVLGGRMAGTATTIHSLMYIPDQNHTPQCPANRPCTCPLKFVKRDRLDPDLRLIIVDEASMVNEEMYEDFRSYGLPTVWIGDHGQLPPVKGRLNLMERPDVRLETIHRQAAGSPILKLAMLARKGAAIPYREFGPGVQKMRGLPTGLEIELCLCWRKRTRVQMNSWFRDAMGFPADQPVAGDRVICLRNNHPAGLFNGMMGTVTRVRSVGEKEYRAEIDLDDRPSPYVGLISKQQFGQADTLGYSGNVNLFDYGYCLTVHKAQGSEADKVLLFDEYASSKPDRNRWLYTAITRAKSELTIVTTLSVE